MRFLKSIVSTTILLSWGAIPKVVRAEATLYRAGEFTIMLDSNELGRTYKGCDAKNQCVNLTGGTTWRDNGYRGITWENGEYTYSISWKEGSNEGMSLNVFKNSKKILQRKLKPLN